MLKEGSFSINEIGDRSGQQMIGDFAAKKELSTRDTLRKDQIRRQLLGNEPGQPSEEAETLAIMVSEVTVRLTNCPSWFKETNYGLDLSDTNVLFAVFNGCLQVQKAADEERKKAAEKAKDQLRQDRKQDVPPPTPTE